MTPPRLLTVAIAAAGGAIGAALAGDTAAGVVLVALSAAIAGTVLRHHLRKDPRP